MPNKPKNENTATITDDELANAHTRLLRRARRYISEAPTLSDGKLRYKEMVVLFQSTNTNFESKVLGKCPPGKVEDRATGLCVTKPQ
jgi:hypothetical protein